MGMLILIAFFFILFILIIFITIMAIYIKKNGVNTLVKIIFIGIIFISVTFFLDHYESESDILMRFRPVIDIFEIDKLEDLYSMEDPTYISIDSSQCYDDGEIYHVIDLDLYLNRTTNEIYGKFILTQYFPEEEGVTTYFCDTIDEEEYGIYYDKGEFHFMEEVSDEVKQKLNNHIMMFEICDIDEEYLKSLKLEIKDGNFFGETWWGYSNYKMEYKIPNDDKNLKKVKEAYPQYMPEDTYEATYELWALTDNYGYSYAPRISFKANNECDFSLDMGVHYLDDNMGESLINEIKYPKEEEKVDYASYFESFLSIFESDKLDDIYEKGNSDITHIFSYNKYYDNGVGYYTSMHLYLNNKIKETYGRFTIGEVTKEDDNIKQYNICYDKGKFHFMEEVSNNTQQKLDNHKLLFEICDIDKDYLNSLKVKNGEINYDKTWCNVSYKIPYDDKNLKKIKEVFSSYMTENSYQATYMLDSCSGLSFYANNKYDFELKFDIDFETDSFDEYMFDEIKYSNR